MKSIEKDDKGFSLIELIVTIAVIAIVIIPFLKSFFTSMEINSDARKIQNATAVAQDTVEKIKAKSIEDIIEYYQNQGIMVETTATDAALDTYGRTYPKYVFKDINATGADTEDFYLTVTLDASPYSDVSSQTDKKLGVNSMTSPQFSSLFGADVVMLFKQYTNPDNDLESYFRGKGEMSEAELADISPKTVTKSTDVSISGDLDTARGLYVYNIHLVMTYTYKDGKNVVITRDVEKTYQSKENHAIYMLVPVYDNESTSLGHEGGANGGYYSSDKINIIYQYIGVESEQPELSMYIAEQETAHADGNSTANIKSENISVTNGTKKSLYSYGNDNKKFKIFTNVQKSTSDSGSTGVVQGLTYSENLNATLLYEITVDVRYRSKDADILTTFTSSKED